MFVAHEIAMELITAIRPVVERVAPRDKDLAGQMRRAATSAAAKTAGGGRRSGGDRLHAFRIASAEAAEAVTHARSPPRGATSTPRTSRRCSRWRTGCRPCCGGCDSRGGSGAGAARAPW
ncbi:MAG: four helix bundle protein [Kofleriaceae bacterium]|nr:four helix bundle protein [Kofleriaceae bacterium]